MDACRHCIRRWWRRLDERGKGELAIAGMLVAMEVSVAALIALGWFG